jgi:putative transposase
LRISARLGIVETDMISWQGNNLYISSLAAFFYPFISVPLIYIRKEFPNQVKRFYRDKPIFWHSAYFIATCGGVTVEQLKLYVQQQESPTDDEVLVRDSSRR